MQSNFSNPPNKLPLLELIPDLSQLRKLTYLWLYISRNQLDAELSKMNSLPVLLSVRVLYLEIFDLTIDQFCGHVAPLFPNLEVLTLKCLEFDQIQLERQLKVCFKCLQTFKLKLA